jgi:hypothetical protein
VSPALARAGWPRGEPGSPLGGTSSNHSGVTPSDEAKDFAFTRAFFSLAQVNSLPSVAICFVHACLSLRSVITASWNLASSLRRIRNRLACATDIVSL